MCLGWGNLHQRTKSHLRPRHYADACSDYYLRDFICSLYGSCESSHRRPLAPSVSISVNPLSWAIVGSLFAAFESRHVFPHSGCGELVEGTSFLDLVSSSDYLVCYHSFLAQAPSTCDAGRVCMQSRHFVLPDDGYREP